MKIRKITIALLVAALLIAAVLWRGFWEPRHPEFTYTNIVSKDVPNSFDGFRILLLSDLHGRHFGEDAFFEDIRGANPDVIVLCGDVLSADCSAQEVEGLESFSSALCAIAPTYFVSGNHEVRSGRMNDIICGLRAGGAVFLDNAFERIKHGDEEIVLAGLCDVTALQSPYRSNMDYEVQMEYCLKEMDLREDSFVCLLAHRPEYAEVYANLPVDLALCGHTHAGQIRIPFLGAVLAPGQGLFPKYCAGLYSVYDMQMYVSRGIGGDFRFACLPEVAVLTLRSV